MQVVPFLCPYQVQLLVKQETPHKSAVLFSCRMSGLGLFGVSSGVSYLNSQKSCMLTKKVSNYFRINPYESVVFYQKTKTIEVTILIDTGAYVFSL